MFKNILLLIMCTTLSMMVWSNPMRPDSLSKTNPRTLSSESKASTLPKLKDIVIIGQYRIAIFSNERELTKGQAISGYTIDAIEPDFVLLRSGNRTKKLELLGVGDVTISPAKGD